MIQIQGLIEKKGKKSASSGTSKLCCRQSRDKELHRTGELEKKVLELSAQPAKLPRAHVSSLFLPGSGGDA